MRGAIDRLVRWLSTEYYFWMAAGCWMLRPARDYGDDAMDDWYNHYRRWGHLADLEPLGSENEREAEKLFIVDSDHNVREVLDIAPSRVRPYVVNYIFPKVCPECGPFMSNTPLPSAAELCPKCKAGVG